MAAEMQFWWEKIREVVEGPLLPACTVRDISYNVLELTNSHNPPL